MKYDTGFNMDYDTKSQKTAMTFNPDDNKAQQQFGEECDINTIVKRFGITGKMPENFTMPVSIDVSDVQGDYHKALLQVEEIERNFMQVPAEIRRRFENDPQQMLDFLHDKNNQEEAYTMGIAQRPPEQTRDTLTTPAPSPAPTETKK